MKKLIPAISMTLLGAALLGTSTYAWFSANKTVTATGLSLQAKADSSLLISKSADKDYSNTVAFAANSGWMTPVKPTYHDDTDELEAARGTYTFEKLNDAGKALVDDQGVLHIPTEDDEETTGFDESDESNYFDDAISTDYYVDTLYLKYDGDSATQTVTVTGVMESDSQELIFPAYRVAIVQEVVTTTGSGEEKTEVITHTQVGEIKFTNLDEAGKQTFTGSITLTAGVASKIVVYSWLHGADSACKNQYAVKGDSFTVGLNFTIPSSN